MHVWHEWAPELVSTCYPHPLRLLLRLLLLLLLLRLLLLRLMLLRLRLLRLLLMLLLLRLLRLLRLLLLRLLRLLLLRMRGGRLHFECGSCPFKKMMAILHPGSIPAALFEQLQGLISNCRLGVGR